MQVGGIFISNILWLTLHSWTDRGTSRLSYRRRYRRDGGQRARSLRRCGSLRTHSRGSCCHIRRTPDVRHNRRGWGSRTGHCRHCTTSPLRPWSRTSSGTRGLQSSASTSWVKKWSRKSVYAIWVRFQNPLLEDFQVILELDQHYLQLKSSAYHPSSLSVQSMKCPQSGVVVWPASQLLSHSSQTGRSPQSVKPWKLHPLKTRS